jgi:hypothetical protein
MAWRFFRDPAFTSGRRSSGECLTEQTWRFVDYELMDEKFIRAMQGAGYAVTGPSSHAGTKAPRAGYRRP